MITGIFLLILIPLLIILLICLFIFIPIGHESDKVRRLPWITIIIIASCIIIYILLTVQLKKTAKELLTTAMELQKYYYQHPYLELDLETKKLLFGERANEDIDKLLGIDRKKTSRQIHLFQEEEQDKLDQLAQEYKDILDDFPPYRKWGFYPAQKSFIGLVTYMFVHAGFWHVFFNLLFLYLSGSYIEEVWGRPIYTAFYLIAGMFAGLMHSLYYPNSVIPLVGSSGAVAGLMGAFLIRYWKVKIRFFWLAYFLVRRRTLDLPARVVLPLWLVLQIFYANLIDHFFPGMAVGGTAYWVHVWGFLFGVVVAAGMKRFKIEEKYIDPKIDAQVHFVDEGYKAFEEATQKRNEGNADEAYALLLVAARKNPMDKDVVEGLWNQGKELGKEKEAAEFYIRMIEREIRHNLMDVAFEHFADLKEKVPQASISMTCKFTLMTYLTERQDHKEAKELASELLEEVDLNSSPGLLQNFASAASEHSPEVAKKVIELCLKHPGITDDQKDTLRTKLKELQNRQPESPPVSDMGEAHEVVSNTEHITAELEGQLGLKPEVRPLADSVGQTREELIGQHDVNPESKPAVVSEIQYKTQPEGQPAVKQESQPAVEPPGEPLVEPEGQPSVVPESQSVAEAEVQPVDEPKVEQEDEVDGQPAVEPEGQGGVDLEGQQAAEPDIQSGLDPEAHPVDEPVGQQGAETEGQHAVEPEIQQEVEAEGKPADAPVVQPLADAISQPVVEIEGEPAVESEGQGGVDLGGQQAVEPEVQSELSPEIQSVDEPAVQQGVETEVQPAVDTITQPVAEPENQPVVEIEGKPAVEPQGQPGADLEGQQALKPEGHLGLKTGLQPIADAISQPVVEPDKPEKSPSPNQPIMAAKATPLNVKDGKIALNMDQLAQQLLPLDKVKSIAVAEIAADHEQPYVLIDLFLDDPKKNDRKIRTIRLLSTSFDPTKFSPGIQDKQDALKVFVSVLLKLSGATPYPEEDTMLLEAPQRFSSIESYEKSILA